MKVPFAYLYAKKERGILKRADASQSARKLKSGEMANAFLSAKMMKSLRTVVVFLSVLMAKNLTERANVKIFVLKTSTSKKENAYQGALWANSIIITDVSIFAILASTTKMEIAFLHVSQVCS